MAVAFDTAPSRSSGRPSKVTGVEQERRAYVILGVDARGVRVRQPIPAVNEAAAVRSAHDLKIQVERVLPPESRNVTRRVESFFDDIVFAMKLSESKLLFWSDVAEVVRSRGPLVEALTHASENAIEARFRAVLLAVLLDVQSTKYTPSTAMDRHKDVFTPFEIDVVGLAEAGEISLPEAVDRIVSDLERDRKYRLRRIGVEWQPRMTTIIAVLLFLVAGKIVPGIYRVQFETHLPYPLHFGPFLTFASGVSDFVLSWVGILIFIVVLPSLFSGYRRLKTDPKARLFAERMKSSGSWWSRIIFPLAAIERKRNIERMCSLYALLLKGGKRTFLQATQTIANTVESEIVRNALRDVVDRVMSTKYSTVEAFKLSEPVVDPVTVRRFTTVATRGGSDGLSGMFANRAIALREELDLRDFEMVIPRIQLSSAIPLVISMTLVGLVVNEPIWILLSSVRIR